MGYILSFCLLSAIGSLIFFPGLALARERHIFLNSLTIFRRAVIAFSLMSIFINRQVFYESSKSWVSHPITMAVLQNKIPSAFIAADTEERLSR